MNSLSLAAAASLFSTSALAFAPSTEPAAAPAIAKDPFVVSSAETVTPAPFAWTSDQAVVRPASAVRWEAAESDAGDPDLDLAVDPDAEQASLTGMGGPEEPLDVVATAAPVAAAPAYRPCRPGPGDDNCIQLYEPGVREALATWTPRTAEATAMGGPYEPVDGTGADTAMAGDGAVDMDMGETSADEVVGI
jgi:hypothetical protein